METTYEYDESNFLIKCSIDGMYTSYTNDEKGNRLEEKGYDKNNNYQGSVIYIYDKRGNLVRAETYDSTDTLTMETKYTYKKKG